MDATMRSVVNINRILDHNFDNMVQVAWACDRIAWLAKFCKISKELVDALCTKAYAVMRGEWYEDMPEEAIIIKYIKEGRLQ